MAPLQDAVIPIDFGGGVDTKTDPKKVVPGKFLLTENGVYTSIDRVQKRNGNSKVTNAILGGGTLSAPRMVKAFNNEMVCQDQGTFYGYSPTLQVWVPKGSYQSVDFSKSNVFVEISATGYTDVAILNNIAVYVWDVALPTNLSNTYATVIDSQTGEVLLSPTIVSNFGNSLISNNMVSTAPRCVVLGGTTLAITYLKNSTGTLAMRILTATAGGVSFGSEITIGTSTFGTGVYPTPFYDIVGTSTGAALSYRTDASPGVLTTKTLDTAGTVTHTATHTLTDTTNHQTLVHVCADTANGNIWVYYGDNGNTSNTYSLNYVVYSSTLSIVSTFTAIITGEGSPIANASAVKVSTTQQTVYYSTQPILTGSRALDALNIASVTSSAVVSGKAVYLNGVLPQSRVFTANSRNYMAVTFRGPQHAGGSGTSYTQPTYFLLDLTTAAVVARFASALAYSAQTPALIGYVSNVATNSASSFTFPCGIRQADSGSTAPFTGIAAITFNYNTIRTYKSLVAGQNLILNGALVSAYDGKTCAELGFHLYPEIFTLTQTGSGGSIAAGTYSWIAIFQWTDSEGNLHQSQPSVPVTLTVAASSSTVTASVSANFLSGKSNVHVYLFRTLAGGTVYFQTIDQSASSNISNVAAGFNTISDTSSDATIQGNLQAYITGGVVENSPPPPALVLETRLLRLWLSSEEDSNLLWYTKSYSPGTGLSPTFFLTVQIDPKLGAVAALASMDDKMIVLKDKSVFWFGGDGANDTGANSSLSDAQPIPSDVGCTSLGSVVVIPKGVMFQSANGIYLLDRSLGLHYADQYFNGAAVEQYNGQTFVDARMTPGVSQVRLLTTSGTSLVYDYIFDKWGTFTNYLGYSSDIIQNVYTYVRTDGNIYQENATSYLDDTASYALKLKTSWLALGSVQGFERVRIAQLLGDYASGSSAAHGVQISFAYDFAGGSSPTYGTTIPFTFAASSSGVFQYRTFPTQQKCDAVSLLIEEIVTGASGEYLDLTNLSFNAGLKKGLNKLAAASSVG